MVTNMTLVPIHGTRLPDGFVATYVDRRKQRPSVVVISLSGFLAIDNSTRVSAVERLPR